MAYPVSKYILYVLYIIMYKTRYIVLSSLHDSSLRAHVESQAAFRDRV